MSNDNARQYSDALELLSSALYGSKWEYIEISCYGNIILHGHDNRKRKPPKEIDTGPAEAGRLIAARTWKARTT